MYFMLSLPDKKEFLKSTDLFVASGLEIHALYLYILNLLEFLLSCVVCVCPPPINYELYRYK